ncbi:TolB amino-terminal domain-containing protein [Phyllobacterium sp. CL33Tsu]|uniref:adenylate cyclase n=1 Tax=Phyllobacterium sp. CL33Tsu TaxID=1798191 RepID=UPI0008EEBE17|nr:adenylate cyclase [Phyllobacterium sp. CL33Tsu]SFJ24079.1 TolB amino-terminal domain-containing protein [Phyllobacterium sp. CL33Tsu]
MQDQMEARTEQAAGAQRVPPAPEDIRAQLDRMIASPEFPNAGHAHAFLRYVVEETLAGRAERIKGYSIAIEVFNRDEGFNQDDPVVRIEAGRLRRTLERYYLIAGKDDPVRIDIPKGKYVPYFSWNEAGTVAEPAVAPVVAPPKSLFARPGRLAAWMLAAAIAIALLGYWTFDRTVFDPGVSFTSVPNEPSLVVAPFANLGESSQANLYALGLTEELLTALPRFKELKVFGRETSEALPTGVDASHIRGKLGARYLLTGGVRISDDRVRVTSRLIDTATNAILWSDTYEDDLRSRGLFAIQTDVANKVAKAIAQPYGIITQVNTANPPPDDLDAYGCTLRFYAYRAELSVERHANVRACLETAVARYSTYATAWAMLSIVYLDEDRFGYNPRSNSQPALQRALQAARRAVELEPDNSRALQALMTALFFNQQLAESMRVGEEALAINPNDTELMGEYGVRLAMGGEWKQGAQVLDQALAFNPGGAGYYHGNRALAAYMLEDYDTALIEIRQANLEKFPLFHLVAAVIYAEKGMMDEAKREGDTFVAMRPGFIPNLVTELKLRNIQPNDQARMIAGIRKAGLLLPPGAEAAAGAVPAAASAPSR